MSDARPDAPPAESMHAATRALCNVCGRLVDAKVVFRQGKVYLVKWCDEHGRTEALVSSDEGWYRRSLSYVKPGTLPGCDRQWLWFPLGAEGEAGH